MCYYDVAPHAAHRRRACKHTRLVTMKPIRNIHTHLLGCDENYSRSVNFKIISNYWNDPGHLSPSAMQLKLIRHCFLVNETDWPFSRATLIRIISFDSIIVVVPSWCGLLFKRHILSGSQKPMGFSNGNGCCLGCLCGIWKAAHRKGSLPIQLLIEF